MSLTYGFYNSINEDRKYNASQMSKLFDGVLNDGIFMSIGDKFMVTTNSGMNISVGSGRAWFDHTWTLNDSILVLPVSESEILLNRIDVVVLEVNNTAAVRANSIKIIKGAGATVPVAPDLVNSSEIHQYPLAHIYVGVGVTEILQANITNYVGTAETPFATGVMQTMSIDALVAQWQSEWDVWSAEQQADYIAWFNNINALLGTEPATNLQLQVTALQDGKAVKPTNEDSAISYSILKANGDGSTTFENIGYLVAWSEEKTGPVDADRLLISDSAGGSNIAKRVTFSNIKATLKVYFDTLYSNYTHPTVGKTTPVDADNVAISDSAASGALKKLTWANIKATLKTYFDTLYALASHTHSYLPLAGGTLTGKASFQSNSTIGAVPPAFNLESIGINSQAAGIAFHRPGAYGINFGLDTDNAVKLGGWTDGLNTFRFISDTAGNFTAGGNVTAYSDERLKDNIVTIPNALDKVLALRGVEFDRNGVHNIGLIAQEVQKVIPEIVLENSDEMKTLSVAYANLVGLLIEGMKEQQKQIDELKAKVN